MKKIEIDDELYHYIASRTQAIGETASDILRRLLRLPASPQPFVLVQENTINELKALAKPAAKKQPTEIVDKASDFDKGVKRIEQLLKSEHFVSQTKNVQRFLMLLSVLYRSNPEAFAQAAEGIQGSERRYFARDEASILASGSSAKAKLIPDSPYWVITNNNTERKGRILVHIMGEMKYPQHLVDKIRALFY
ncbi:Negative modulator of initiation of replication [Pasteurellaceae bacterium RH1A]|nr:Negative modulator of initiation of replication [Pasteurellaceae bacterium RH1A]